MATTRKYVRVLKSEFERMQNDISDMRSSCKTSFERCRKCHRLHDSQHVCPCGHDNSDDKMGDIRIV